MNTSDEQSRAPKPRKVPYLQRDATSVDSVMWRVIWHGDAPMPFFYYTQEFEFAVARPNFIELPTRDLAASQVFFDTVFGIKMTNFGPTYACTLTGDVDVGLQADPAEATRAPLPVFEVTDLEVTLANVIAAGGAVTKSIFSFPGGRRFHFLDPSGNELAAMQADAT